MATVDPCTLPLVPVLNDTCVSFPLGKQFVQLLYQEMSGTPPDLISIPPDSADIRLATLQAAMTAVANGGRDKLYTLSNLAGGLFTAPADQKLSNNDVPYGGERITDRVYSLTARVDNLTPSNSAAMDNLMLRGHALRVWLVDENQMVRGYIDHAYVSFSGIISAGIGNAQPTHRIVTVSYRAVQLREAPFSAAPLYGVSTIVNAA